MADVPVRLHPEAEQEANNVRAWYAERSSMTADAFLVELDAAISSIAQAPQWSAVVTGDE